MHQSMLVYTAVQTHCITLPNSGFATGRVGEAAKLHHRIQQARRD